MLPFRYQRKIEIFLIIEETRRGVAIINIFALRMVANGQRSIKTAVNCDMIFIQKPGLALKITGQPILLPDGKFCLR